MAETNFKSFFRGINLRNNILKNAKVADPVHEDHAIPKKYVDSSFKFLTEKGASFNFPFITDPNDKTLHYLMSSILYGFSNTAFINPALDEYNIDYGITPMSNNSRYILQEGNQYTFTFYFKISEGDRSVDYGNAAYIKVVDPDDAANPVFFYNDNINVLEGNFDFTFTAKAGTQIYFGKMFSSAAPKIDQDGNEYIDTGFETEYPYEEEISLQQAVMIPTIFFSSRRLVQSVPTYTVDTIPATFPNKNSVQGAADSEAIYDILIPFDTLFVNGVMQNVHAIIYYKDADLKYRIKTRIPFITKNFTFFTGEETVYYNGATYLKCQYHFGMLDFDYKISFDFSRAVVYGMHVSPVVTTYELSLGETSIEILNINGLQDILDNMQAGIDAASGSTTFHDQLQNTDLLGSHVAAAITPSGAKQIQVGSDDGTYTTGTDNFIYDNGDLKLVGTMEISTSDTARTALLSLMRENSVAAMIDSFGVIYIADTTKPDVTDGITKIWTQDGFVRAVNQYGTFNLSTDELTQLSDILEDTPTDGQFYVWDAAQDGFVLWDAQKKIMFQVGNNNITAAYSDTKPAGTSVFSVYVKNISLTETVDILIGTTEGGSEIATISAIPVNNEVRLKNSELNNDSFSTSEQTIFITVSGNDPKIATVTVNLIREI